KNIHVGPSCYSFRGCLVRGGQLWGTDIYTDDSDLVAVLMHTGYCRPTASPLEATIQELRVTIRVLPPQDCYLSMLRNNVRSRSWGAAIGCSYRVERCCVVKVRILTIFIFSYLLCFPFFICNTYYYVISTLEVALYESFVPVVL
ncbi:unnamed protein product, partial [Coffea canephora]